MRLADLNPKLEGTVAAGMLRFDCPLGHAHKISIPIGSIAPRAWSSSGEFPDSLSLAPSIHAIDAAPNDESLNDPAHLAAYEKASVCGWHGFVTNGEVTSV